MTQKCRAELGAHGAQACVGRVERHSGHFSHLRNAELFDQGEHENLALFFRKAERKALHEIRCLSLLGALARRRISAAELIVDRLGAIFASDAARLLVCDISYDSVEPSPELRVPSKAAQATMDGDEDFLRGIVEPARGNAQSPETAPNKPTYSA